MTTTPMELELYKLEMAARLFLKKIDEHDIYPYGAWLADLKDYAKDMQHYSGVFVASVERRGL